MDNYNYTRLPNGITVISENIPHVESFSLGFWFNVGSRDENSANNGISHFLEHMFFKGTKKRNARKIADDIETLGGYLNAFTSKEHTCFYGRGLAKHIERTFEVISDMLENSLFKENEVNKEAKVIIDELNDIEDSPEELIFDKFEANIFNSASLGLPVIGTRENIESFSRENLFGHIKNYYTNQNLYIAASGAVDHNELLEFTAKYLNLCGGPGNTREKIRVKPSNDLHVLKETQQVYMIWGTESFGFSDERRSVLSVISHILGEGSSSRLFQSLREKKGIAYQINSFLNSYYDSSSFGVFLSTNEYSVAKAHNLIELEFKKIASKRVSRKELKRAKEYLKGNLLMSLESTTNRMVRMAQSAIYFDRIKTVQETVDEINRVTIEDVFETSELLFDLDRFSKVIISPKNLLFQSAA